MAKLIPHQLQVLSHLMWIRMENYIKNPAKKLQKQNAKMVNAKLLSVQMESVEKQIKFFQKINNYQLIQ